MDEDLQDYQDRICYIRDAKHREEVGTDDEPIYRQCVRLLMEDDQTGATFVVDLGEEDVRRIANLDYELSSKEMIKYAEVLRKWEQPVRMMAPRSGQKVTTDMLLNTRPQTVEGIGPPNRAAAVKRFGFPIKNKS